MTSSSHVDIRYGRALDPSMAFIARGMDTHRRAHTYRLPGQKHARWLNTKLTQHTIALTLEWINPLCYSPPSTVLNNTQLTTWRFLIKAPYLGNLSVIYDAENKGFGYFSSAYQKIYLIIHTFTYTRMIKN